ncbi:MAG: phenylalanine--tRNA ligase subunit alpha [Bacillota bacterium]
MREKVERILQQAQEGIAAAKSQQELESLRVSLLGKKGQLTALLRGMGELDPQERPLVGQMVNEARGQLEQLLKERRQELEARELQERLATERIDITLPGLPFPRGREHVLQATARAIERIFLSMGFSIAQGPELEWDYLNFEALNIPADHPARDMQDSFYVTDEIVLRTQTSPVQVRTMQQMTPNLPVRIIAPGRVYRRDDDVTHSPVFHQIEGLVVDQDITMGDLKGTLRAFAYRMYGPQTRIRLRPSYFPFTEPSAEVDVSCTICGGTGCRVCGETGWLEILGCGMVHPRVLKNGGYDPDRVTGFAFGLGIERVAMLKYGIDDIRLFYQNDFRFLRQF